MLFSILEPSEISQQSKIFSYYYSRSLSLLVSSCIFYNNGKQAHSYSKPRLWFKSGLQLPGKIVIKKYGRGTKIYIKITLGSPVELKLKFPWKLEIYGSGPFGLVLLIWFECEVVKGCYGFGTDYKTVSFLDGLGL